MAINPDEPSPTDIPGFIESDPKLAAAWQSGEIRRTSDLLQEPAPPVEGPRGLGSRAVSGYELYMETRGQRSSGQAAPPTETMDQRIERLRRDAADKAKAQIAHDMQQPPSRDDLPSDDNRRPYQPVDPDDLERIRRSVAGNKRPTSAEQNQNERRERGAHFRRAGRWQRRRS